MNKNMNKLIRKFIINSTRLGLWIGGGYLMGQSFSSLNSFSAELMFSFGFIMALSGFYV